MGNPLSNFRPSKPPVTKQSQPPAPSKADALGVAPPALTPEQKAGMSVEGLIVSRQTAEKVKGLEKFKAEKAAFEAARDAELWARIEARRRATI